MQASFAIGCGDRVETHPVAVESLSELREAVDIALSRKDADAITAVLTRTFPGAISVGKIGDVKGFSGDHDLLVVHYSGDGDEELDLKSLAYARWCDGTRCDDDAPPAKRVRLGEPCSRSPSPAPVEPVYENVPPDETQVKRRQALQSAVVELRGALIEQFVRTDLALLHEPMVVDAIELTPNSLETRLDIADVILCTDDVRREQVVAHLRDVAAGVGSLDVSLLDPLAASPPASPVVVEI